MEKYEYEQLHQQPVTPEQPQSAPESIRQERPVQEPEYHSEPAYEHAYEYARQTYHAEGTGRKESPFASSPYEINYAQRESNTYRHSAYVPPIPPEKPKKQRKPMGKLWKRVLTALLAVVLVAGSCGATAYVVNEHWEDETEEMMEQFNRRFDAMQAQIDANAANNQLPDVIYQDSYQTMLHPGAVYEKNVQTVVLITAQIRTSGMFGQTTGASRGSGFVLTENGYVVTNHHVVDSASAITVTLHDGTEYSAKLVGSDSTNDVAVLKIEEEVKLQAVTVGSSDALNVGDQVIAIGNPLGELTSTLTVGYVSAKERDVTTDGTTINMIQTDAAINSGNSGGPLFNAKGEVVGITTAKYSGSSSSGASIEGIGFAIPIDDVMPLVDDLMNYGYINSAFLGVIVSDVDPNEAAYYGLPVGAYVQEVNQGYCAEKAGLKAKDIIVAIGDIEVDSVSELTKALRKFKAGDTTTVTVFRGGQEKTISITLDEKPRDTASEPAATPGNGQMPPEGSYEDWYNYFAPFFNERG